MTAFPFLASSFLDALQTSVGQTSVGQTSVGQTSVGQTSPWYVYLLRCADDTLYCGITTDPQRRLRQHNAGKASKYTRGRLPVSLYQLAACTDKSEALRIEYAVKQQPADQKAVYLKQCAQHGQEKSSPCVL